MSEATIPHPGLEQFVPRYNQIGWDAQEGQIRDDRPPAVGCGRGARRRERQHIRYSVAARTRREAICISQSDMGAFRQADRSTSVRSGE